MVTNELNKILKKMRGKPMNKEQKRFLAQLREKVKRQEISVTKAQKIWREKYFLKEV